LKASTAAQAAGKLVAYSRVSMMLLARPGAGAAVAEAGFSALSQSVALSVEGRWPTHRGRLVGDPLAPFAIDAGTGAITVADESGLVAGQEWTLVVRATDANAVIGEAAISVEIMAEVAAW